MIITTGGVSVGKKDIMHESLRLIGAERIFWRVKMKPGMPTLFSAYKKTSDITATDHCASGREIPIISLSGNPFGVAVSNRTFDSSCTGKNDAGSINRSEGSDGRYGR